VVIDIDNKSIRLDMPEDELHNGMAEWRSVEPICKKGVLAWWEAFVISRRYGMGDPLAPSEVEGNSGGGRHHPSVTP